jgi:hypothetical protein
LPLNRTERYVTVFRGVALLGSDNREEPIAVVIEPPGWCGWAWSSTWNFAVWCRPRRTRVLVSVRFRLGRRVSIAVESDVRVRKAWGACFNDIQLMVTARSMTAHAAVSRPDEVAVV